ncbi:MAG: DUF4179 domain-containing protein [Clostridiaceae bacterium]|nr:DUF4179 domain-containing protein [Clostridiaceae bacterium]
MINIEKMLQEKKKDYDNIEAPEEMEERLRGALRDQKPKVRLRWNSRVLAAVLIMFIFVGYHFDTFAYYSKRIVGYDGVMSDSLKDLNQLGSGQEINKSYTFKNGVEMKLDAIIVDDNQMIAFYRIKDPNKIMGQHSPSVEFKGFLRSYRMRSGMGEYVEDDYQDEMIYMANFETPGIWERRLDFSFSLRGDSFYEEGTIPFTLNRNKAMGHSIKQKLNHKVVVENIEVYFNRIVATPTQTLIEGSMGNRVELLRQEMEGSQKRISNIDVRLLADGKEIASQGWGISTSMKGITFDAIFEPLPLDVEKLEIQLLGLSIMQRPNLIIDITNNTLPQSIKFDNQEIKIENVEVINGNTHITVETEESMLLLDVALSGKDEKLRFRETSPLDYDKKLDGTITYSRVIIFEGEGEDLQLTIGTIVYTAELEDVILPIDIK